MAADESSPPHYYAVSLHSMTLEHYLQKLISFPTVTGDTIAAHELFDWVKSELQPVPLYIREYEHGGIPSLVITPTRRKSAKLWLAAHIDVVAAPEELFHARREDTKLIGRGAIDMKFAVACYLHLLKELGVEVRRYDIGVMLTADEEWGTAGSVQYLLQQEGYTGDVAFLPDGSGWWKFEESAKGLWGLEVSTTGVAAHGSKPWLGRSAIVELIGFLSEVQARSAEVLSCKDPEHWYTTLNVGLIEGGAAFNMVAPTARATVDVRYVREADRRTLERTFAQVLKRYPHTRYTVTHSERPYGIGRRNEHACAFERIAQEQCDIACGWVRAHGASDARFFNAAGVPTILIGPRGGGSHADEEWVDIVDLMRYYGVLRTFVREVARKH